MQWCSFINEDDLARVKPKADELNFNELKTAPVDLNK